MKKLLLYCCFFLLITKVFAQVSKELAENTLSPHKAHSFIKTNPMTLLMGSIFYTSEYRLAVETVTAKNQSAEISVAYLGKNLIMSLFENAWYPGLSKVHVSGYRLQAGYKFFLNRLSQEIGLSTKDTYAPYGLYVGPHISWASAILTDKYFNQFDMYTRTNHFNVTGNAGMQFRMLDWMTVDLFTGIGYKHNTWIERRGPNSVVQIQMNDLPAPYSWPLKFMLGFNVGVDL